MIFVACNCDINIVAITNVKNMFPTCDFAFVIGGNEFSNYNEWIKNVFALQFKTVQVRETGYCSTFAISGSKL